MTSIIRSSTRIRRLVVALLLCVPQLLGAQAPTAPAGEPVREIQLPAGIFSLGDAVPAWVEASAVPPASEGQPVVIQLADTQFMVGDVHVVYVRRAMRINDAGSLSAVGQIPIGFVPQYQRLRIHAIRVIRGGETLDRTSASSIRFLQRETDLERGIYSGEVTASVLVSDLRVGDTLEYVFSVEGHNPVFGRRFFDMASWDQVHPVELRRVIVSFPAARAIAWKFIGPSKARSVQPAQTTVGALRRLQFEERSIPAAQIEPYTPPDYHSVRSLQFSEFSRWQEVVEWAQGLFRVEGTLDENVLKVVNELKGLPAADQRVARALEFVQSEIRYFSVALGESSHRPTHPNVVLERRYGDCKDKSLLLIALLRELGIEARPVLLKLHTRKGLDLLLPTPQAFDHVIVQARVDDQVFYLDPARYGQRGRLQSMGQAHEGAQVLVVTRETQELNNIRTPNADQLVREELHETATLAKLAESAELEARYVWHGVAAEGMRLVQTRVPRDEFVKFLTAEMDKRYPGATVIGAPSIEDRTEDNTFTLTVRYAVPKFAEQDSGAWFVRVRPGNFANTFLLPPSSNRVSPVVIPGHPMEARYTIEVRFPDTVSAMRDPRNQTIRNKHFTYGASTMFRGNVAKTTLELKTLADRIEPQELSRVREDLARAGKLPDTRAIVVLNRDIKPGGLLGLVRKDLQHTLRERLQETIERTSGTIKSSKLTGEDLANTYCSRASAHSELGQYDNALRDANEAVKLTPNSEKALSCRAEIHFNMGEFQKSVADYSKALSLGAAPAETYYRRGISRFYLGQLEAAAEDLLKASEADTEVNLYAGLWLTWTQRRLGQPVAPNVAQRAAERPDGDWPRPALAMLNGKLSPEEMLRLLARKRGDELTMAQAEAYFYLAQHYLAQKDTAKAREYFEKTRELGIIVYIEHIAARFELERLAR